MAPSPTPPRQSGWVAAPLHDDSWIVRSNPYGTAEETWIVRSNSWRKLDCRPWLICSQCEPPPARFGVPHGCAAVPAVCNSPHGPETDHVLLALVRFRHLMVNSPPLRHHNVAMYTRYACLNSDHDSDVPDHPHTR